MGGKSTTQTTTTQPPAAVMQAYQQVMRRAKNVSNTPYQPYTGGFTPEQTQAFGNLDTLANNPNPAFGQASTALSGATVPSYENVGNYENPFQSDVINSTMAQLNQQDAVQQQQVVGNAIQQGAMGGNRVGVAQAQLAGQQALANNATLANLNSANFSQALAASQADQAQKVAAANAYTGLGQSATQSGLASAIAQLEGGSNEQNFLYGQYANQQAYPFQTTQFLANIAEGIGSQSGGTSSTTTPDGNGLSSAAGLGLGLLGLFMKRGGRVDGYDNGGGVAGAGLPYLNNAPPLVPIQVLPVGHTMPNGGGGVAPQNSGNTALDTFKAAVPVMQKMKADLAKPAASSATAPTGYVPAPSAGAPTTSPLIKAAEAGSAPVMDLSSAMGGGFDAGLGGLGVGMFGRGGMVRGYDDGGFIPDPVTGTVIAPPQIVGGITPAGGLAALTPPQALSDGVVHGDLSGLKPADVVNTAPAPVIAPTSDALMPAAQSGVAAAVAPPPAASVAPALAKARGSDMAGLFATEEQRYGLPAGYLGGTASIESRMDPAAHNPASGASGLFQFVPKTAAQYGLDNPADPVASTVAAARFAADNKGPLAAALGREPTAGELYLAHQQGLNGAIDLLTHPDANASALVGSRAILGNGGTSKMTAGQFASMWSDRFANGDTGTALAFSDAAPPSNAGVAAINGAVKPAASPTDAGIGSAHSPGLLERLGIGHGMGLSDDARMALISAGLGMMAGRSPHALQNIGAGGLAGVQAYQAAQKQDIARAQAQSEIGYRKSSIDNEAERLRQTAASTKADIAKTNVETQAAQENLEALRRLRTALAPGTAVATPGSPATAPASAGAPSDASLTTNGGTGAPGAGTSVPGATLPPAAKVEQTSAGPVAVNEAGQPLFNVGTAYQQARAMIASGIPAYVTAGSANMRLLETMLRTGSQFSNTGGVMPLPGAAQAAGQIAGAKAGAQAAARAQYQFKEIQPEPGGPTYYVPASQIAGIQQQNPGATVIGPGPGAPPGSGAIPPNAVVAKQPAFIAERQKTMMDDERSMLEQYQARQTAEQRLGAIQGIMQNFQTGNWAEEKAGLIANLRAMGFTPPDTATANPAAFQAFMKDATANVFDQVKGMGGRPLVAEIAGLIKANANPELQPAANAAIIAQGLGALKWQDQYVNDYFDWKKGNPNAYDPSQFDLQWTREHPLQKYVDDASKAFAYKGQEVPTDPNKRVVGQVYMTPKGQYQWTGGGWAPVAGSNNGP